jgi:hypothetical protein
MPNYVRTIIKARLFSSSFSPTRIEKSMRGKFEKKINCRLKEGSKARIFLIMDKNKLSLGKKLNAQQSDCVE